MEKTEQKIVGIRFSKVGKLYNFDAAKCENIKNGDVVVVETSRGWQLGEVAQILNNPEHPIEGGWKLIDRLATPKDLIQRQFWQAKEPEVVEEAAKRAKELRLKGVKIVMSEYSFDGTRLTVFFSCETEEKVELKSLRSDLQRAFSPAQVEVKQIGPRDVAKYLGGMGACGLETRCCSKFITDFSSISIRMAKEQGISLTPTEITGMCGRLRCCLIYEYDNYVEARKLLPKKNKRVLTPDGEGKVLDVYPIRECLLVEIPEVGRREYHKDVIRLIEDKDAIEKAAETFPKKMNTGCENCPKK